MTITKNKQSYSHSDDKLMGDPIEANTHIGNPV